MLQTEKSNLALQVTSSRVTVRWKKDKNGKVFEQSVVISGKGDVPWEPSGLVFLGGLSNALWQVK